MKDFVIKFGTGLIDFSACCFIVLITLCTLYLCAFKDLLYGLGFCLCALILFVLCYYFIYLAIDIRDCLFEIKNQLVQENKNLCQSDEQENSDF